MRPENVITLISVLLSLLYAIYILRYLILQKLRANGAPRWKVPDYSLGAALFFLSVQGVFMIWVAARQKYWQAHSDATTNNNTQLLVPGLGLPRNEAVAQQKFTTATTFIYIATTWSIKITFLLYYYDFNRHLQKRLQQYLTFLSALVVVGFALNMLVNGLWCIPISGTCPIMSRAVLGISTWSAILSDILLMVFPILVLKTLRLRGLQKCAVGILPGIAALTAITSLIRFAVLLHFMDTTDRPSASYENRFRLQQHWHIASTIEMIVGVFSASQPALRALVRRAWRVDYGYGSGSKITAVRRAGSGSSRTGLRGMEEAGLELGVLKEVEMVVSPEDIRRFPYA